MSSHLPGVHGSRDPRVSGSASPGVHGSRDPRVSGSTRSVGHVLQHLNTTTSIGEALKTFWNRNLTILLQESFPKKTKIAKKFPGLATSGRHNSAIITNADNSRPNSPSSPHFYGSKATMHIYSHAKFELSILINS